MALRAKWDKRLSETGLGLLVTAEQVQSRLASTRCTDPLPFLLIHTRRTILSSMAKLVGFGWGGRVWHCCQLDNLHRTGIGWHWLCQGPRCRRGVLRQPWKQAAGRKEPQVSIATQFSQLGALELSLCFTKQSHRTKKRGAYE